MGLFLYIVFLLPVGWGKVERELRYDLAFFVFFGIFRLKHAYAPLGPG